MIERLLVHVPAVLSSALWARGSIKGSKADLVAAVALLLLALWLPMFAAGGSSAGMSPAGLNLLVFGCTCGLLSMRKGGQVRASHMLAAICIFMGLFMQILI